MAPVSLAHILQTSLVELLSARPMNAYAARPLDGQNFSMPCAIVRRPLRGNQTSFSNVYNQIEWTVPIEVYVQHRLGGVGDDEAAEERASLLQEQVIAYLDSKPYLNMAFLFVFTGDWSWSFDSALIKPAGENALGLRASLRLTTQVESGKVWSL